MTLEETETSGHKSPDQDLRATEPEIITANLNWPGTSYVLVQLLAAGLHRRWRGPTGQSGPVMRPGYVWLPLGRLTLIGLKVTTAGCKYSGYCKVTSPTSAASCVF